jgi:hypothetical protein
MKTPLQNVIERLEDLYAENDGHTAYQQGVLDCIDVCVDNLQYERDEVVKRSTQMMDKYYIDCKKQQ